MNKNDVRGRFIWHGLMTHDTGAAANYYAKVAGWTSKPWEQDPNYLFLMSSRGPVGGIMKLPPEVPAGTRPHWMIYIGSPNVDETVAAAQRLGARLNKPATDITGVGRYAVLTDPQGAAFVVTTPAGEAEVNDSMTPIGNFSWHELATTDYQAAFNFYRQLFGWEELQRMNMGPNGIYLIFGWGGKQRGGIYNKMTNMPGPPHWLPYAHVASADAAAERARAAGGRVVHGPTDVAGGDRIAQILDPHGAAFAVHSTKIVAQAMPAASAKPAAMPAAKQVQPVKKTVAKKAAAKKRPARAKPARRIAANKAPRKAARRVVKRKRVVRRKRSVRRARRRK
ncbi:MAG: VOC family protein [Steroidobacteraceae bacterium]